MPDYVSIGGAWKRKEQVIEATKVEVKEVKKVKVEKKKPITKSKPKKKGR